VACALPPSELAESSPPARSGSYPSSPAKRVSRSARRVVGNLFKTACEAAGIRGKSAHGIRKAAATTAANNGATVATLEAIFGWEGGQMAALYTNAADRKRLAQLSQTRVPKLQFLQRPFEALVGEEGLEPSKS